MPVFYLHFKGPEGIRPDDAGIDFPDLEAAYFDARHAIPEAAKQLLIDGRDPMVCAFLICDSRGRRLMEVPFTEVLSAKAWSPVRPSVSPSAGFRSEAARRRVAVSAFQQMLGPSPLPHGLVTPELELIAYNPAGEQATGVHLDAVLNRNFLDPFGFDVDTRRHLEDLYAMAARGLRSQATNLRYTPAPDTGLSPYWFTAEAWPVFDDDGRLLALANHALVREAPQGDGRARVMAVSKLPSRRAA